MRFVCAWCDTLIRGRIAEPSVSHALCAGCLADLRTALSSNGVQLRDARLQPGR